MKIVLREVLSRSSSRRPARAEQTARRSITFSPTGGATVILRERRPQPAAPKRRPLAATA